MGCVASDSASNVNEKYDFKLHEVTAILIFFLTGDENVYCENQANRGAACRSQITAALFLQMCVQLLKSKFN